MTIETVTKDKKVGKLLDNDKERAVIIFENSDGVTARYTEEVFESRGFSIENGEVMKEKVTVICTECSTEKLFYNSFKDEYYCPRCEE